MAKNPLGSESVSGIHALWTLDALDAIDDEELAAASAAIAGRNISWPPFSSKASTDQSSSPVKNTISRQPLPPSWSAGNRSSTDIQNHMTYIRNAWSNKARAVGVEDARLIRAKRKEAEHLAQGVLDNQQLEYTDPLWLPKSLSVKFYPGNAPNRIMVPRLS